MAENGQTKPWAPVAVEDGRDQGSAELQAKELRRRKRIKWCKFIIGLIIVEIIVFAILGATLFKIRSPRIRITLIDISKSSVVTTPTPSFKMSFNAQLSIKNRNMGQYKFSDSTLSLSYNGVKVGEAQIPKGKAKMKGTRRLNVTIDLSSANSGNHPNLGNDLTSGVLTLNAYTKLKGKVTLMYMMKRKKSGEMNCTIAIQTNKDPVTIQSIDC